MTVAQLGRDSISVCFFKYLLIDPNLMVAKRPSQCSYNIQQQMLSQQEEQQNFYR
jgi:hypothetical protein